MCDLSAHPFESVLTELRVAIENVVGAAMATVRSAELRALAEANPAIAACFLAEELRRWRTCSAVVNSAHGSLI